MIDPIVDGLNALGPAWLWFGIGMRNGDMHHAAALAEVFKKEHGTDLPIRLVVTTAPAMDVAKVFDQHFASVHAEPSFLPTERDWREFFLRRQLPFFGPNIPLILHPDLSPRTSSLHALFTQNQIVWGQIYKSALGLPADVEPAPPALSEERSAKARELMAANGMPQGRCMVLFPYAQSFPADAGRHFELLAEKAKAQGFTVFTSVAPGEVAIPGTRGVFIPFEILVEVAEQAGWIVAVRSGICDITATARCVKTFIFGAKRDLSVWGLDALELARDAKQIAFSFENETPESFCIRVLNLEADAADGRAPTLSDRVWTERQGFKSLDFSDALQALPTPSARRRILGSARVDATRLINLPRRDHYRLADKIDFVIQRFVAERGSNDRFYACRDRIGAFDFFEEVDRSSLLAGRYWAAGKWHTIIAASKDGLASIVPTGLKPKILPRRPFELGHFQHTGRALRTEPQMAYLRGDRPIDLAGLQLLDGWYDLEQWGLWSKGDRSTLKFSVSEPTSSPVTLELDCKLIVTQPDDILHLSVRVNGEKLLTRDVLEPESTLLRVTIPPALMTDATAYVEFDHPDVRSPQRLGHSGDLRRMALGLVGAVLRHGS